MGGREREEGREREGGRERKREREIQSLVWHGIWVKYMTSYLICHCNLLFSLKRTWCFFPFFFPCHYIHTNLPLSSSLHSKPWHGRTTVQLYSSFGYVQFLLFFGLRGFFLVLGGFCFCYYKQSFNDHCQTSLFKHSLISMWQMSKLRLKEVNYLIHSSSKRCSKLFLQLIIQYLFSSFSLAKELKQLQIYLPQSSL